MIEEGGRESEREQEGALVEEMLGLTRGAARGYVALSFCALDTHRGALADRLRVGRGLSEVLTWQGLTWSSLTRLGCVVELRTVRPIGGDCPPL